MVIFTLSILLRYGALFGGRNVKRARNCATYLKHQQLKGRQTSSSLFQENLIHQQISQTFLLLIALYYVCTFRVTTISDLEDSLVF